jgi:Fe2+ transport system protein B
MEWCFHGFIAGVTLIIPYVLPFYLILAFLEDSGYLTRISVTLDCGMHKLGLHGAKLSFFGSIMSPVQLIVLALVSMIYIPCLANIFAIKSEFG